MDRFKTKHGLVNMLICLLIVVTVVLMFVPSIHYAPGTEKEGTTSVFSFVFLLSERSFKPVVKWLEEIDPGYAPNQIFSEPMLILVFGIVSIALCISVYKGWFSSVFPCIWGAVVIKGCTSNILFLQSSMCKVYFGLGVAVILLAALAFIFNTAFKAQE